MSEHISSPFDPELTELLGHRFGRDTALQVTGNVRYAEIPYTEGERVPYVRVNPGSGTAPRLIIPGFSSDLQSRAAYLATCAKRGIDATMVGQNRISIPRTVREQYKCVAATALQAMTNIAVVDQEKLDETHIDIDAHSFGAQVCAEMARQEEGRFKNADVVLRAPAGLIQDDNLARLVYRTMGSLRQERRARKDYPELEPFAVRSTTRTWQANLLRTRQECMVEIPRNRLDHLGIVEAFDTVMLLTNPGDKLFPERLQATAIMEAVEAGAAWVSPRRFYDETNPDNASTYDVYRDATHNIEACSPGAMVEAVSGVFAAAHNQENKQPAMASNPIAV